MNGFIGIGNLLGFGLVGSSAQTFGAQLGASQLGADQLGNQTWGYEQGLTNAAAQQNLYRQLENSSDAFFANFNQNAINTQAKPDATPSVVTRGLAEIRSPRFIHSKYCDHATGAGAKRFGTSRTSGTE